MTKPILLIEKPALLLWGGILSWMGLLVMFFAAATVFTWCVGVEDSPPPIGTTTEPILHNLPVVMGWEGSSEGLQLSRHFSFLDHRGRVFNCEWDDPDVQ